MAKLVTFLALIVACALSSASAAVLPKPGLSKALKVRGGAGVGDIWTAYNDALENTPLVAKCGTSFTGFAIGDLLAQLAIEKNEFDLKRLVRMATFGLLVHGSTGHYFYNFLDSKLPGNDLKTTFLKVAIDQTLWAPIFMVMFFTYMGAFDMDFASIIPSIKDKTFDAVQASWKTWIPAHTINFKFVPSKFRLFYINAIQIGFNCFLSIIGSKKVTKEA